MENNLNFIPFLLSQRRTVGVQYHAELEKACYRQGNNGSFHSHPIKNNPLK